MSEDQANYSTTLTNGTGEAKGFGSGKLVDETLVIGFCGFLAADIPELHGIHPQRLADSWQRFKVRCDAGEWDNFFAPGGEG